MQCKVLTPLCYPRNIEPEVFSRCGECGKIVNFPLEAYEQCVTCSYKCWSKAKLRRDLLKEQEEMNRVTNRLLQKYPPKDVNMGPTKISEKNEEQSQRRMSITSQQFPPQRKFSLSGTSNSS